MAITLLFLAVVAAIAGWWLAQQRLTAKPWLETGAAADLPAPEGAPASAAKVGLGVFLAVAGSLFALFLSAYFMRMHLGDWQALPVPRLLWLNTALLVASSLALQLAAWRRGLEAVRGGLLLGGALAVMFLIGQLLVWRQLSAAGYYLASNPANSFFYLLTAVHGLHLLGGLVALGRPLTRLLQGAGVEQIRAGTGLCALYWHFLLLVWLILFGLVLLT